MPQGAVPVPAGRRGTLVLVVGPSGAGKDSLIAYSRVRVADEGKVVFPRRFVTRPPDAGAEDHVPLTEAEFRSRIDDRSFALHWLAHGLGYGVPVVIADELISGRHVVVNVSRAVIDDARRRFSPILVVSVTAPAGLLADRLRLRGRESSERIGRRLQRASVYDVTGPNVVALDNSGPIEQAGEALLGVLRSL